MDSLECGFILLYEKNAERRLSANSSGVKFFSSFWRRERDVQGERRSGERGMSCLGRVDSASAPLKNEFVFMTLSIAKSDAFRSNSKTQAFFSIFHRLVCLVFWRVLWPLGKRRTEFDSAVNDDFGIAAVVEGGKLAVGWDGIVCW